MKILDHFLSHFGDEAFVTAITGRLVAKREACRYFRGPLRRAEPMSRSVRDAKAGARAGGVAERSKAHAWKVCIRQKRIVGSNPTPSATLVDRHPKTIRRRSVSRSSIGA